METDTDQPRAAHALAILRKSFGNHVPAGYLQGKTSMRNALVMNHNLSLLEAERAVDRLEMNGMIVFEGDPTRRHSRGTTWRL